VCGGGACIPIRPAPHISDQVCPVTQRLMRDPVICADGTTYDRAAIRAWFRSHHTSPLTNLVIPPQLIPNLALREEIAEYVAASAAAANSAAAPTALAGVGESDTFEGSDSQSVTSCFTSGKGDKAAALFPTGGSSEQEPFLWCIMLSCGVLPPFLRLFKVCGATHIFLLSHVWTWKGVIGLLMENNPCQPVDICAGDAQATSRAGAGHVRGRTAIHLGRHTNSAIAVQPIS
jgi:hypothetical protein